MWLLVSCRPRNAMFKLLMEHSFIENMRNAENVFPKDRVKKNNATQCDNILE